MTPSESPPLPQAGDTHRSVDRLGLPAEHRGGLRLRGGSRYDGVELMVWGDPVSQDIRRVGYLSDHYQVPVLSIHAPRAC